MLYLDVPIGDALVIDDGRIVITFKKKTGQDVRVQIDADRSIPVKVATKERHPPWAKGLTDKTPRKSGEGQ